MRAAAKFRVMPLGLLVVVLAASIAGCAKLRRQAGARQPEVTAASPRQIEVEVTSDPGTLAAARRTWKASREMALAGLLANPASVAAYDSEALEILRSQRERSVRALTQVRDTASKLPNQRIDAIAGLKLLGVPPDPARLAQLAAISSKATQHLLSRLDDLYPDGARLPAPIRDVVLQALRAQGGRSLSQAARGAARHRIPEAVPLLHARIRRDPKVEVAVLDAAATLQPDAEITAVLVRRLAAPREQETYWLLTALADVAEAAPEPAVRDRALGACFDHLRQRPDEPWTDGGTLAALEALASVGPPEARCARLSALVRDSPWTALRRSALRELDRNDAALATRLRKETGLPPPEPGTERAPGRSLTPAQAAAILVRHQVLTQAEAAQALRRVRTARPSRRGADEPLPPGPVALLEAARRFASFDVETGTTPNRHDRLLLDLAQASAGRLRPEAAHERYVTTQPDADTGDYTVQFIHGRSLYRFRPEDLGDWYDLDAVLAAIHRALADAGIAERFVPLASEGQVAELVFANPERLRAAAAELGLELTDDADAARRAGQEFEDEVSRSLKTGNGPRFPPGR